MRTIKQIAVPQNSDPKFPQSTILNETDTEDGTPVVEEIYGDVLTNIYKLLQVTGISPTGDQDNDLTQYQILEALKKLPNSLNDSEQIMSLTGSSWSVPLNIDLLPNKYFLFARATDNFTTGGIYTFKGLTATSYPITSSGFVTGDELLVIIDQSTARAYSLTGTSAVTSSSDIFPVMGNPISFNDTSKIWYQDGGSIVSDVPSIDYLENIIRVNVSDATAYVNDIIVLNGKVLCFCAFPATNTYFFRQFDLGDLSVSVAVSVSGITFGTTTDNSPYIFAEQGVIYVSNECNNSVNDYSISKLNYDSVAATLAFVSTSSLDISFEKTTNSVIKSGFIYTMISGAFNKFSLVSGAKSDLGTFPFVTGQLFGFNGGVYYSSGEVGKKWF